MVESSSDDILAGADHLDVAFLVVGDPFGYAVSYHPKAVQGIDLLVPPPTQISFSVLASAPSLPRLSRTPRSFLL